MNENSHFFSFNSNTLLEKGKTNLFFKKTPRKLIFKFLGLFVFCLIIGSIFIIYKTHLQALAADPINPADAYFTSNAASITGCAGQSECFVFTIDTRLDSSGGLTGTTTDFIIPISGGGSSWTYSWIVNWGDGTSGAFSGTSSPSSSAISKTYSTPGQYQISIRPNGTATTGWFDAFGFHDSTAGANTSLNKNKFRSINTPFSALMKSLNGASFNYLFCGAINGIGIPTGFFSNINTSSVTNFNSMFNYTFYNYAYNSTSATIPANIFSTINTSKATNLNSMFNSTFSGYARNSTSGTIPAGLFSTINTSKATNLNSMFNSTFSNYAINSTSGTIPAGLFSTIDTSSATDLSYMFTYTFASYAYNSTSGTIPAGLFSTINTSKATNLNSMFNSTFSGYARNSTSGTIPTGLFNNINTPNATNLSSMFSYTFSNYAYNSTSATIPANIFSTINTSKATSLGSMFNFTFSNYARRSYTFINSQSGGTLKTASFQGPYATKNGIDGSPSNNPTVTAGDMIYSTYNSSSRIITAPSGDYTWYSVDGTSCTVETPSADCGVQSDSTRISFPNDTYWTSQTSTEEGDVTFYSSVITDIAVSATSFGEWLSSGDTVATLSATSSLGNSGFNYSLVDESGNNYDNSYFTISGPNIILNNTLSWAEKPTYTINVKSTDSNGNEFMKKFTFNVIQTVISLDASSSLNISNNPGMVSSVTHKVVAGTNSDNGFRLLLSTSSNSRDLVHETYSGSVFSPSIGSINSPSDLSDDTWGFRIPSFAGFGAGGTVENNVASSAFNWAGVPSISSPANVLDTSVSGSSSIDVYYGLKSSVSSPSGKYSQTILYTAISN